MSGGVRAQRAAPRRGRLSWFGLVSAALVSPLALAQKPAGPGSPDEASRKSIRALRVTGAIKLDGVLDEPEWLAAQAVSDFVQQEPQIGEPASERTLARVLVDRDALYVGVSCFDREPARIVARELRRDNALQHDDRFEIVLDTFHDHRNSYHFAINPLGTQYDAQITDEGQDVNVEWDERWYAAAAIGDLGWTAEIRIPLTALRSRSGIDSFGINFKRFIRRKNEIAQWSGWSRDYSFLQVSQAGHLTGVEEVRTGLKLRVKPYTLGGFRDANGGADAPAEALHRIGLEDLKFGISSGLTAELTLRTDFAQTEVDDAVVNLTRFPTFFPEKREFFLERAGIFEFGLGGRRGGAAERNLQMFFPRRIGLTADRREVPMLAGAKVVGRAAGLDVGLLNVETGRLAGLPRANYTVLRAKRNVLSRSNLGAFVSNRQTSGSDYNRVVGADANFTLFKNTDLQGFLGKSFTPGRTGDDWVGRAKFNRFTDIFELFLEHLYVGKDFQHDIGFVRRNDVRRTDAAAIWEPRPHWLESVRNFVFRGELVYTTDVKGRLLTRERIFQTTARFQSDDALRFNTTETFDRLERAFAPGPGVVVAPGEYSYRDSFFEAEAGGKRPLSGKLRFGFGDFYSGRRRYWQASPSFRPSAHVSLEAAYERNTVTLPRAGFTSNVVNARLNVNLSNRWLTTTLGQYDSAARRKVFYFRLNYIYRPGDDVFVVYTQSSQSGTLAQPDRALLVKLTYSFDLR